MAIHASSLIRTGAAGLLCAWVALAAPAAAEPLARATLVQCGAETCVRLSGRRASATTIVRVDGRDVAVEGGRAWHATVPVATARSWTRARDYTVMLSLIDAGAGRVREGAVPLPPGSLGAPVELASLVVRAH